MFVRSKKSVLARTGDGTKERMALADLNVNRPALSAPGAGPSSETESVITGPRFFEFLRIWLRVAAMVALLIGLSVASAGESPFAWRGYYMTFMRMPQFGLEEWKQMINAIEEDRGNMVIIWMGGGFRSRKFPITSEYNAEHRNVRKDFGRELIDYAHAKKIKVLLALTPFGYDGVNQYPIEHHELKAVTKEGKAVGLWGMHSWGYNLCPAQPESQRFMLEYSREMLFDFYPNADGLMIESSDYAICHCPNCGEKFFENEFQFVRKISVELWARKPEAVISVTRTISRARMCLDSM
jgi:hypothetical protein